MANTSPWHHLYNTKRWKQLRKLQLEAEPLCAFCRNVGKLSRASVADHVVAHKGDLDLFFEGKLQSLCKHCHDSYKQKFEKTGNLIGHDESGLPLDEGHHWMSPKRPKRTNRVHDRQNLLGGPGGSKKTHNR